MDERTIKTGDGQPVKAQAPIPWLERNRVAFTEIVPNVAALSDYDMQQLESNSRRLSKLLRTAAQESVQNNLAAIRNELEDQKIDSANILGIYDLAFIGMNVLPKKLLEDSATLRAIIEAACTKYPELAIQEQTDVFTGNSDLLQQIHSPIKHILDFTVLAREMVRQPITGTSEDLEPNQVGGIFLPLGENNPIEAQIIITKGIDEIEEQEDPEYDNLLFNAVSSLYDAGNREVPLAAIVRAMDGTSGTPSPKKLERAKRRIDFWRQRIVKLDVREEYEERRKNGGKIPENELGLYDENALMLAHGQRWKPGKNGGRWIDVYVIKEMPVFTRYAMNTLQFEKVRQDLLKLEDVSATEQNVNGRNFLLRRIYQAKRIYKAGGQKVHQINYERLGNAMKPGITLTKDNMMDVRKFARSYLEQMKKAGIIDSWKEYTQKRTYAGVAITVNLND